jgi:hypothetical protein
VKPALHLVARQAEHPDARLRILVPALIEAEAQVRSLSAEIAMEGRRYANERGEVMRPTVARLKMEFGNG